MLLLCDKIVMMALLCMFERGRGSELCPASVYFGMSYVILGRRCQAGLKNTHIS